MDSDRIFFVTAVTTQRQPIFRREATATLMIDTLVHYRDQQKFLLHGFVIMPDHVPQAPNDPHGLQSFAYCYGYIRGLMQASA